MTQARLLLFPAIDRAQGRRRNAAQTQGHVIQIQPGNAEEMRSMHAGSDGDANLVSHLEDWQQWKAGGSKYPQDETLEPSAAGGLPCVADLSSPQLPEPAQSTTHPPANVLTTCDSCILLRPNITSPNQPTGTEESEATCT